MCAHSTPSATNSRSSSVRVVSADDTPNETPAAAAAHRPDAPGTELMVGTGMYQLHAYGTGGLVVRDREADAARQRMRQPFLRDPEAIVFDLELPRLAAHRVVHRDDLHGAAGQQAAGQPPEVRAEILGINEDARPQALQVALLVPLLASIVASEPELTK